jgi:hypothetical protein
MSTDATQASIAEDYEEYAQYAAQWEPETPFEQRYEFVPEAPMEAEADQWPRAELETPFVSQYGEGDTETSLEADTFRELLFDLYDTEMDRAVGELVQEAAAAVAEHGGVMGETFSDAASEQFLESWIDPVREQASNMLDGIAERFQNVDAASLTESEIDRIFEQFEPEGTGLEQYFEDFLKSLWQKAKKVAAGAIDIAKKGITMIPGLSGLLGRLKALVAPLLQRVLKMAMDKLPPQLRPIATQLARRIVPGFQGETEGESLGGQPAVPDVAAVQREFDQALASLLVAGDETEQEAVLAKQLYEGERIEGATLAEYHEARERFVDQLERGQDPQQALEQFIPALMAIMPIARTVIGFVGRPRVVSFLAGYLAQLIQRYVGPDASRQLSQAVVDAGLRMIGLEVP